MPDKGVVLLAIIATVAVVGAITAFVHVIRSRRRHKRPEEEYPSFQEELGIMTTKPAPSISGPAGDFWKLFVGDERPAAQLRRGGRFSTRAGHRITVNVIGEFTVVVVAQSRGADEVRRHVCHRHPTKGLASKTEPREMQDGHISDAQAHNTDRDGMSPTPDAGVRELIAVLGECYPTPVSIR